MTTLFNLIRALLANPILTFGLIAFMSTFALAAAILSEAFLGLEPCILCIYQRYPFVLGLALGLLGLTIRSKTKTAQVLLAASGIGFLINSSIALYQTGVQLYWWTSKIEGCAVPIFLESDNPQSILENLMSAPMSPCDEIQWIDPILGLTMANYNIVLCFGLFVFCFLAAYFVNLDKKET